MEANPASRTANVTYDASLTSLAELTRRVEECGMRCAGRSVPAHICDPMEEPDPAHGAAMERTSHGVVGEAALPSPRAVMGHGGHAGMSMEAMARDMRNRFLVAAAAGAS